MVLMTSMRFKRSLARCSYSTPNCTACTFQLLTDKCHGRSLDSPNIPTKRGRYAVNVLSHGTNFTAQLESLLSLMVNLRYVVGHNTGDKTQAEGAHCGLWNCVTSREMLRQHFLAKLGDVFQARITHSLYWHESHADPAVSTLRFFSRVSKQSHLIWVSVCQAQREANYIANWDVMLSVHA